MIATALGAHDIRLDWTAVTGAAAYDLRVTTNCPLSQTSFGSATAVPTGKPQSAGTPETAVAIGLPSDVANCFLLKVTDAAGQAAYSASVSAVTLDDVPPAAPVLTAVSTRNSVTIGWLSTGDDGTTGTVSATELRYLGGADCPINLSNFSVGTLVPTGAPQPAGTSVSATVTGLTEDAAYCFLLKATDKASNSVFSNALPVRTADVVAPATPELQVDASAPPSETAVRLTWVDPGDNGSSGTLTRQVLRYWPSNDFCVGNPVSGVTSLDVPVTGPGGTPDGITLTLQRETSYCFLLTAYDEAENSASSAVLRYVTPDLTPPSAPAVLVDAVAPSSATLRWVDVGDDGDTGTAMTYMLHSSEGAGCATFSADNLGPVVLAQAPEGSAGTPDHLDLTGLSQGSDYCMAVRVIDSAGNAAVSNIVAFHTPLFPPGAVTNLAVLAISPTRVEVTFIESGRYGTEGTVPAYDIRYATGTDCDSAGWYDGAQAQPVPFDSPIVPMGPGSVRTGFASLDATAPLCVALEAVDGSLRSPLSSVARPPAPVSNLSVTAFDAAGAGFAWTAVGAQNLTGTADHYEMVLAPAHGGCPADGFSLGGEFQTVVDVADLPAPQPPGTDQVAYLLQQTPGHAWCAALRTVNAAGSASFSNVVSIVNPDSTPPAQPSLALDSTPPTAGTIHLVITATGDDGTEGAAEGYEVRAQAGCSDPASFGGSAYLRYALSMTLSLPQAGSTFPFDAWSLTPDTDYCLAVVASDTLGNSSTSAVIVAHTAIQ